MRLTNARQPAKPSHDSAARILPQRTSSAAGTDSESTGKAGGTDRPGAARPSHWRPDIEGLRAVAVGAVIAAHIGFFYSGGGFVGVDVFFVISGFLITSLLLREIDRTGTVSIAGFYARRAVRLLPAAAVVLVATLVASWLWLPRTRLSDIAADAATATLNVVNLRLAREGTDYLNADVEPSPLQHFWSLAVEEQFYLVWPLILVAVALATKRLYRGRFVRKGLMQRRRKDVIAAVLLVAVAFSFALSATQTAADPVWSYFGIHTRAWELGVGALIAVGANRLQRVPRTVAALASWIGLGLIVASVFVLDERTVFPGTAAALPVAGAALVIAAGCVPHRFGAQTLLGIAPAQYLGKVSYGLYLWHWPLIMIGPSILGIAEPRLRHYLMLMVAAFLLTVASFYLVEQPIRTRKSLVVVPSRALAMGGGLLATGLAVAMFAALQPVPTQSNEEAQEITGDETTVWELLGESSDVDTVPANITPSLDTAKLDEPALYADGCVVERGDTELAENCWFGDPEGQKTLVLYGDSHAAQWFPPLNQVAQASGWKMLVLSKAACSAAVVEEWDNNRDREYTECPEWRENAFAEIDELQPDMVIAANSDDKEVLADDPDQAWVDGWSETAERIGAATEELYVLLDTAFGVGNVPDCLSEHPQDATECVNDLDDAIMHPQRREAAAEAVAAAGAHVVDPIPWICDIDEGKCPVVVGNLLVYRDSNHLSSSFAAELGPQLAAAIPLEMQSATSQ